MTSRIRSIAQLHTRFERRSWLLLLLAVLVVAGGSAQSPERPAPPPTRVEAVRETIHGVDVVDPYRWLEDRQSPETSAWIDAQNRYTRGFLDPWPGRDVLRDRLTALLKIDVVDTPRERNGLYFFTKRLAAEQQRVIYLRRGLNGKDEVLVDPHPMSADGSISVGIAGISADGAILSYHVRRGGEDEVELRFLDVKSRKDLPDRLPRARQADVNIRPDKKGFFYRRYLSEKEGSRIYYHAFGTDPAGDQEIFGKGYSGDLGVSCGLSDDGRYLVLFVFKGSTAERTEVYFKDLSQDGPIVPVVNNLDARFIPDVGGDLMILQTNWNAPRGRVIAVDLKKLAREDWREIIPESDAAIESAELRGGKILVQYTRNASSQIKVFDTTGKPGPEISLPAIGTVAGVTGRWDSPEVFYTFSSFHVPATVYRLDLRRGTQQVWARPDGPLDAENIETKQVWFESRDKTRVPMFLVYPKGTKRDGNNPVLMYGYGGFNVSMTPSFNVMRAAWVASGGVVAVVTLRGGGEFGEEWHRAGMLEKKQNVFDDYIAAAEWLVQHKYSRPEKLAISGGSNGGLLVGAAMTQRPDLFRAVLCFYPLLDMVRYHKFSIARFWVPEYGSSEDAAQFKYIYAYSPYHHVQPGTKYPAVMFITGDGDTRVEPLHARKMAALVQASTGSDRPVLLRYDTKAGHVPAGASLEQQISDNLDYLTFLFWQLGVSRPEGSSDDAVQQAGKSGVTYPSCISYPNPEYSEQASRAGYEGIVILRVIVTPEGLARNIQVVKRLGMGLDEKAVEAVSKWRFKPATGPDGKPIAVWTSIEVNFRVWKGLPRK